MKFAHLADCHLGGWTEPEMEFLNMKSFQFAIEECIREKVEFILIAGDLFDSAYPPIDVLKESFQEFRKLKEANIPVFLIAGSHDYSVSGKTFLDVLEKAGFCKNVSVFEERSEEIFLLPTLYKNVAIYGYPGKKSGLEVDELSRMRLHDSPGLFKILMLHTAISSAVRSDMIKSVDDSLLPLVDYTALGHLHIPYSKNGRVYSGPTFPNNISELEELKGGSFYIFNNGALLKKEIKLKEVASFQMKVDSTLNLSEKIISEFQKANLKDKIVILRLYGILQTGKISDIDWKKIEAYLKESGVYSFLRSTTKLILPESSFDRSSFNSEFLEENIISEFQDQNPSRFNSFVPTLIKSLQIEKNEDERSAVFQDRLFSEVRKVLSL